ncbi:PREDICTED: lipase maturation factor 1-like [Calidris pugnax]|uniref:lipase maturation factor 1-like n=1 Tax=Calidris pugnax TaxID=198806 RepID=UPI00071CBA93|nr:PREDICTED: lipase maturation factor 1-like [Calidris pugnax]
MSPELSWVEGFNPTFFLRDGVRAQRGELRGLRPPRPPWRTPGRGDPGLSGSGAKPPPPPTGTFWLTRIVLLRSIALLYFVAFLVAYHQNKQLIGEKGLLPCKLYLQNVKKYFKGKINLDALSYAPTIIWFLDWSDMDSTLDYLSLLGLATSAFVLITGCANMVLMFLLWVLYLSLVNVGQIWYSFGWESQLLETGFLGIFLCPLWTLSRLPQHTPPSSIVIWGFRWLIFRIMLGAGLIKIRGDRCWRDLTCMDYHYEAALHVFFLYRSLSLATQLMSMCQLVLKKKEIAVYSGTALGE